MKKYKLNIAILVVKVILFASMGMVLWLKPEYFSVSAGIRQLMMGASFLFALLRTFNLFQALKHPPKQEEI
jgi:hypothetical protein